MTQLDVSSFRVTLGHLETVAFCWKGTPSKRVTGVFNGIQNSAERVRRIVSDVCSVGWRVSAAARGHSRVAGGM